MVHVSLVEKIVLTLLLPFIYEYTLLKLAIDYFFVFFHGVRKFSIVLLDLQFSGPGDSLVVGVEILFLGGRFSFCGFWVFDRAVLNGEIGWPIVSVRIVAIYHFCVYR